MIALVPEMLRRRKGELCRSPLDCCGLIGTCGNHHATLAPRPGKHFARDLADFPASLADKADDGNVCLHSMGQVPEKSGFSNTRPGEDTDSLPAAERQQRIQCSKSRRDRGADPAPLTSRWRRPAQGCRPGPLGAALPSGSIPKASIDEPSHPRQGRTSGTWARSTRSPALTPSPEPISMAIVSPSLTEMTSARAPREPAPQS